MSDKKTLYEIVASNGQVLEHGHANQDEAREAVKAYKRLHPNDEFFIRGYNRGKYGNE